MSEVNALVAKLPTYLIHPVNASNHQHLRGRRRGKREGGGGEREREEGKERGRRGKREGGGGERGRRGGVGVE